MSRKIGYARENGNSATEKQNLEAQIARLRESGCDVVFSEAVEGRTTQSNALQAALKSLEPGDELKLHRRNALVTDQEWYSEVKRQAKARGVGWVWVCV